MSTTTDLINPGLVCIDLAVSSWEEVLDALSQRLLEQGLVRDSFVEAVKERERKFPTGLPTVDIGVAIPHTDPEHVVRPAAALATLARPVSFRLMSDAEAKVEVELVIMLAVRDSREQIGTLQRLAEAFQAPGVLRQLKAERDPAAAAAMLGRILTGEGPDPRCEVG